MDMAIHLRISRNCHFWYFLLLLQASCLFCYQYKVGDLDSWNIPSSGNSNVYAKWAKHHVLRIGDSLLFLYPPSQDSVIQVSAQSYKDCNTKDPILSMDNGNSLFNITEPGDYFFISGEKGHCEKSQKLHIFVAGGNASASSPYDAVSPTAYGPSSAASGPSAPNVFGSIPFQGSTSSSLKTPFFLPVVAIGLVYISTLQQNHMVIRAD
ncbi:unnamed protein product [Cuscuta epithymum]|uniref:Phytocyanin domain-containing protein n=1 Tax=Cuscuta epithymum TaxID=186058 RepID=A0AAV0G1C1_9ASTE|nr:unnamed protein product [Cuscuta epithymum]